MAHDGDTLAEDWVALWQSEMAAMAADRELRESWTGLLALWAGAVGAALQLAPGWRGFDAAAARNANGTAGAAQPAGTPPAAAASDLGGDEARRLHERIALLESRLAAFEQRGETRPAGGKPSRSGKA
jgi:hypothetical protein